jgi:DNA repair photolyase
LIRGTLKLLNDFNFKVLLVTKSDILLRDLDVISKGNIAVTVSINNNDDELSSYLEPGAPPPKKRLAMVQQLVQRTIPVMVRVDPIIPGLNEDVSMLLKELSDIGVKNITTSTYKARSDSLNRLKSAFPELGQKLEKIYRNSGEYFNQSWYLPRTNRERIIQNVSRLAKKYGLGFNVCREGINISRTSKSCDGQSLFD